MKLRDLLSSAGSRLAPTRPIRWKAIGYNERHERVMADVSAVFAFVDERQRQEALRDAAKALAKDYGSEPVPPSRRTDEESYHLLNRALRDADDPRSPFAESVEELKQALVFEATREVMSEYDRFCVEEFPPEVSEEEFKELVAEARTSFLSDLLSSSRSLQIRRAWPSLVAHFGASPTPK